MIAKATDKGCYDQVHVSDIVDFLLRPKNRDDQNNHKDDNANDLSYGIAISCDVLVYLGNLEPLFRAVASRLSPNGIFCFSTEHIPEDDQLSVGNGFVLRSTGRFAHKQSYVEDLVDHIGLQVLTTRVRSIRKNRGQDIMGLLCIVQKGL